MGLQRHQREPIYIRTRGSAHLEELFKYPTLSCDFVPETPQSRQQQNPSAMPRPLPLPDELLEEVLRRLPPDEPAELVRAALVSRRWCRLVSDRGFRRRFREFHRRPPMLGMLCNLEAYAVEVINTARFIPTTAFCTPHTYSWDMHVLDSRHGRVLYMKGVSLEVWNPVTDEVVRELPFPQKKKWCTWTAAILCSAVDCDHLDCHHGPFLVVFVCNEYGAATVYTYSSDANAWSEPVCTQQPYVLESHMGSALVENSLYFGNALGSTALKYDFELRQRSLIRLPSLPRITLMSSRLITTKDGRLGLVNNDDSNLYLWSTKDTHKVDAKWERRVIKLRTLFPNDVDVTKLSVIGSGFGIIFMHRGDEVYKIDLKTYKVKKVYEGTVHSIVPYMSFYTPALKGTCTGEGPSVGHSSAW